MLRSVIHPYDAVQVVLLVYSCTAVQLYSCTAVQLYGTSSSLARGTVSGYGTVLFVSSRSKTGGRMPMSWSDGEHRGRDGGRGEQAAPKRHRIPRFDAAKPCSPLPRYQHRILPYLTLDLPRLYSWTCNTAGHTIRPDMQYGWTCNLPVRLDMRVHCRPG